MNQIVFRYLQLTEKVCWGSSPLWLSGVKSTLPSLWGCFGVSSSTICPQHILALSALSQAPAVRGYCDMWLSKYRTKSGDRLHKYTSLKHGVDSVSGWSWSESRSWSWSWSWSWSGVSVTCFNLLLLNVLWTNSEERKEFYSCSDKRHRPLTRREEPSDLELDLVLSQNREREALMSHVSNHFLFIVRNEAVCRHGDSILSTDWLGREIQNQRMIFICFSHWAWSCWTENTTNRSLD